MKTGYIMYRIYLEDKLKELTDLSYRIKLSDDEIHDMYIKKQLLKELIDELQIKIEEQKIIEGEK